MSQTAIYYLVTGVRLSDDDDVTHLPCQLIKKISIPHTLSCENVDKMKKKLKCLHLSFYLDNKRLLANALPEPDFKYFSKSLADRSL